MAHMVETMAYVGETPWHGLGQKLDRAPSIEEGLRAAGLDWGVRTEPVYLEDGRTAPAQATVRETDGRILGAVGPSYTPLQNVEAFRWFEPLVESGDVELHTAGSLQEGRKVWVLAKIAGQHAEVAKDDPVDNYVLLSNSHDGSRAVRVGFTPIRVVCWNTLSLAQDAEASKLIRVMHTSHVVENLDLLRETIDVGKRQFEATVSQFRELQKRKMNKRDLRKYVAKVFDLKLRLPKDATAGQKAAVKRAEGTVQDVFELFREGRGNQGQTAWDAYNAVTEYLSYCRGKSQDNRLNSLWFGESQKTNERAFREAVKLAQSC